MEIEPLSKKTIKGVVDVEIASTTEWYRYKSLDERIPSTYSDLNPEQRWFHGGATMDPILLNLYWQETQQVMFDPVDFYVAVENNKVLGFTSMITSNDYVLGKHGYIDLLLVHPDARRKGVGRKLIKHLEKKAKERNCKWLYVYPKEFEGPSGKFYLNLEFKKWKEKYLLKIDTAECNEYDFRWSRAPKKRKESWNYIIGWTSSPSKNWVLLHTTFLQRFFDQKKIVKKLIIHENNVAIIGIQQPHPFFHFGPVSIWIKTTLKEKINQTISILINASKHLGHKLGLKELSLVVFKDQLSNLKKCGIVNIPTKTEPWMRKEL